MDYKKFIEGCVRKTDLANPGAGNASRFSIHQSVRTPKFPSVNERGAFHFIPVSIEDDQMGESNDHDESAAKDAMIPSTLPVFGSNGTGDGAVIPNITSYHPDLLKSREDRLRQISAWQSEYDNVTRGQKLMDRNAENLQAIADALARGRAPQQAPGGPPPGGPPGGPGGPGGAPPPKPPPTVPPPPASDAGYDSANSEASTDSSRARRAAAARAAIASGSEAAVAAAARSEAAARFARSGRPARPRQSDPVGDPTLSVPRNTAPRNTGTGERGNIHGFPSIPSGPGLTVDNQTVTQAPGTQTQGPRAIERNPAPPAPAAAQEPEQRTQEEVDRALRGRLALWAHAQLRTDLDTAAYKNSDIPPLEAASYATFQRDHDEAAYLERLATIRTQMRRHREGRQNVVPVSSGEIVIPAANAMGDDGGAALNALADRMVARQAQADALAAQRAQQDALADRMVARQAQADALAAEQAALADRQAQVDANRAQADTPAAEDEAQEQSDGDEEEMEFANPDAEYQYWLHQYPSFARSQYFNTDRARAIHDAERRRLNNEFEDRRERDRLARVAVNRRIAAQNYEFHKARQAATAAALAAQEEAAAAEAAAIARYEAYQAQQAQHAAWQKRQERMAQLAAQAQAAADKRAKAVSDRRRAEEVERLAQERADEDDRAQLLRRRGGPNRGATTVDEDTRIYINSGAEPPEDTRPDPDSGSDSERDEAPGYDWRNALGNAAGATGTALTAVTGATGTALNAVTGATGTALNAVTGATGLILSAAGALARNMIARSNSQPDAQPDARPAAAGPAVGPAGPATGPAAAAAAAGPVALPAVRPFVRPAIRPAARPAVRPASPPPNQAIVVDSSDDDEVQLQPAPAGAPPPQPPAGAPPGNPVNVRIKGPAAHRLRDNVNNPAQVVLGPSIDGAVAQARERWALLVEIAAARLAANPLDVELRDIVNLYGADGLGGTGAMPIFALVNGRMTIAAWNGVITKAGAFAAKGISAKKCGTALLDWLKTQRSTGAIIPAHRAFIAETGFGKRPREDISGSGDGSDEVTTASPATQPVDVAKSNTPSSSASSPPTEPAATQEVKPSFDKGLDWSQHPTREQVDAEVKRRKLAIADGTLKQQPFAQSREEKAAQASQYYAEKFPERVAEGKRMAAEHTVQMEKDYQEREGLRAEQQEKERIFRPIMNGLTSIGDFGAEYAKYVGVPDAVTNAYKAFAPPGSKFHTEDSFATKAVRAVKGGKRKRVSK